MYSLVLRPLLDFYFSSCGVCSMPLRWNNALLMMIIIIVLALWWKKSTKKEKCVVECCTDSTRDVVFLSESTNPSDGSFFSSHWRMEIKHLPLSLDVKWQEFHLWWQICSTNPFPKYPNSLECPLHPDLNSKFLKHIKKCPLWKHRWWYLCSLAGRIWFKRDMTNLWRIGQTLFIKPIHKQS